MTHPNPTSTVHGFHVYNSNRMERLAACLADKVRQMQSSSTALSPILILVPNQGMKRWLQMQLAAHNGIAANLHFEHLYKFLSSKLFAGSSYATQQDAARRERGCNRQILKWQIIGCLPQLLEQHAAFAALKDYVSTQVPELRLHQLAMRLSEVFDRYQMERPEWLLEWQQNRLLPASTFSKQAERAIQLQSWQQPLWQQLYRKGNWHSFADDWHNLAQIFRRDEHAAHAGLEQLQSRYPAGILLFGFSGLSSGLMDILHAMSTKLALHFYYFNPCQSYWGDALDRHKSYGLLKKQLHQQYEQQLLLQGNSLLANLAQSGRNFNNALLDIGTLIEQDQFDVITGQQQQLDESLLGCVQRMILFNRKELSPGELAQIKMPDDSIQFHNCHSARREVEVLKNNLLGLFAKHPELQPRDVLILCSDVNNYAALVQAIFNQKGSSAAIPVAISDVNLIHGNSCVHTFLALLDLAQSQFNLNDVLAILDCNYVAQKFGFDSEDLATMAGWLEQAGVRWGIDAAMRSHKLGTPIGNDNSFNQGMADLAFGLVMPPDGSADANYGDLFALPDLSGNDARLLERLLLFLHKIYELQQLAELHVAMDVWQQQLQQLLRDFFVDELYGEKQNLNHAGELKEGLREFFGEIQQSAEQLQHYRCGIAAVRYELQMALAARLQQQAFLSGKVTLANITPMRAIPAKVIAVLGLGEGSFPRGNKPSGFNLLAHAPQWLDTNAGENDKQSFLELILSARQYLLLSWQGQQHNSRHAAAPSAVLGELLEFVGKNFAGRGQPYYIEHYLHEMEPAYFDGRNPQLFSYNQNAARAACALQQIQQQAPPAAKLYKSAFDCELPLEELFGMPLAAVVQDFACHSTLQQWPLTEERCEYPLQYLQILQQPGESPQDCTWLTTAGNNPAKQAYEPLCFELEQVTACLKNPLRYLLSELSTLTLSPVEQQNTRQESFQLDALGRYKLRRLLAAHDRQLAEDRGSLALQLRRQMQHRALLPQGEVGELEMQQQLQHLQIRRRLVAQQVAGFEQSLQCSPFVLDFNLGEQSLRLSVPATQLWQHAQGQSPALLQVFDGKLKELDMLLLLLRHLALNTRMALQSVAIDMEGNRRVLQAAGNSLHAAAQLGFCLQFFLHAHRRVAAFDAASALAAKIPANFENSFDAATQRMQQSYRLAFDMEVFGQSNQLHSLSASFKNLLGCYDHKS